MKKILASLIIVLLIVGIAVGVYLVKIQQIFKSKADLEGTRIEIVDNSGNIITSASSRSVKVKLTFVASASATPSPTPTASPVLSPAPTVSASSVPTTSPSPSPIDVTQQVKTWMLIYRPQGSFFNVLNDDPVGFTKNTLIPAMNEASKYHGYSNPAATPALNYSLLDEDIKTENNPPPQRAVPIPLGGTLQPVTYDYEGMFQKYDLCNLAKQKDIKAVMVWADGSGTYVGGGFESAITGSKGIPTNGNHFAVCSDKTIVIYMFNYTRGLSEALESYGHHLERVFGHFRPEYESFSDRDSCGNDHNPPNSRFEYDRSNTSSFQSDCRNFKEDGTGVKETLSCTNWGCDGAQWLRWWMQNMPGLGNDLVGIDGQKIPNWWVYIGDPDNCYNNPLNCTQAVQGVTYAQEVFPTHFRVANTQENLPHASERLFDSNPKLIDWQLLSDNGQKTVYAQFKINNSWSNVYSVNIQLTGQQPPVFEIGMEAGQQFDTSKVDLVAESKTAWVRLNFIVRNNWSGVDDPRFIETYNNIINHYTQKGIKIIGLIGAESVKQGFDRSKPAEFQDRLVDVADKITQNFGDRVKVYEVFNEPNDWAGGTSFQLSPDSYASLLNAVYQKVKIEKNRMNVTLVSGPIFSHDLSGGSSGDTGEDYLRSVYTVFNQNNPYPLDAIGLHIYIEQDSSQRATIESAIRRNLEGIRRVIREFDPDKKIWISEMGWGTGSVSEEVQANNLEAAFNLLKNDPAVRMAMWFTLLDFDDREFGLVRVNGNNKAAFQRFASLAAQLNPSPSPSPSPISLPSPVSSPSPAVSPTPTASPTVAPTSTPIPTSSSSPRPGKARDFNGDGKINSFDVSLMFRNWNSRSSGDLNIYDLNSDGVINSFDYAVVISRFAN